MQKAIDKKSPNAVRYRENEKKKKRGWGGGGAGERAALK